MHSIFGKIFLFLLETRKSVSLDDLILGIHLDDESNLILSLLCYLIYKEWFVLSFDKKERSKIPNCYKYACELEQKRQIYINTDNLKQYSNIIELVSTSLRQV